MKNECSKKINLDFYKKLFFGGLAFFTLQVTNLVFQSADPILIAKTLSIKEVASYTIGFKLLNLMILPIQILKHTWEVPFSFSSIKSSIFCLYFFNVSLLLKAFLAAI